jgi:hypothetical protein
MKFSEDGGVTKVVGELETGNVGLPNYVQHYHFCDGTILRLSESKIRLGVQTLKIIVTQSKIAHHVML